jgi:hypothetical protein
MANKVFDTTISGANRIFDDPENIAADPAIPPVISSPTAASTGGTTGSGSVTTDNGTGTLYYIATTNATELAATIKAGSSQAVSTTGVQNVSVSGLTEGLTYYIHYIQTSSDVLDSNVVSSGSFVPQEGAAIDPEDRVSVNKIAYALMDTGSYVSVQVNDIVVEWLRTEGQVGGNLNQMLYGYLGGIGYAGTLDDRMKAWSKDP